MSLSAAVRRSDRKAGQVLGVALTRGHATHKTRTTLVGTLKKRFRRKNRRPDSPSEEEDGIVWDVPNPFASPDPALAHVHALIQAEIACARRGEAIGPLDFDPDANHVIDTNNTDGDDEDEKDKFTPIVLPRLLPIPLRFIPTDDESADTPPPSPSPSSTTDDDEDYHAPWVNPAQGYNDFAEVEERIRKAKRDAHRSRSKVLAILGPEAIAVL